MLLQKEGWVVISSKQKYSSGGKFSEVVKSMKPTSLTKFQKEMIARPLPSISESCGLQ